MNLPFPIRTTGRAAKPVIGETARLLTPTDLAALATEKGSKAPALKRISDRHHALARHIAGGMAPGEAAVMCRYDLSRVSILLADPAFRELLAFYRSEAQAQYVDLHAQLAGLSADAAALLQDKLEAEMELDVEERKIPFGQLMELTKLGADRTGHGPQTSSTNVNVNVELAGRLEAARRRVSERQQSVVIDQED